MSNERTEYIQQKAEDIDQKFKGVGECLDRLKATELQYKVSTFFSVIVLLWAAFTLLIDAFHVETLVSVVIVLIVMVLCYVRKCNTEQYARTKSDFLFVEIEIVNKIAELYERIEKLEKEINSK